VPILRIFRRNFVQVPTSPRVRPRTPEFQAKNNNYLCSMGVLCTGVKLLRNWQILGCELHKNMFGDRALPGPARGAIVLPHAPSAYNGRGMGRKGFLAVCWPGAQSARDNHVLVCNFAKYLFTDLKKNFHSQCLQ